MEPNSSGQNKVLRRLVSAWPPVAALYRIPPTWQRCTKLPPFFSPFFQSLTASQPDSPSTFTSRFGRCTCQFPYFVLFLFVPRMLHIIWGREAAESYWSGHSGFAAISSRVMSTSALALSQPSVMTTDYSLEMKCWDWKPPHSADVH